MERNISAEEATILSCERPKVKIYQYKYFYIAKMIYELLLTGLNCGLLCVCVYVFFFLFRFNCYSMEHIWSIHTMIVQRALIGLPKLCLNAVKKRAESASHRFAMSKQMVFIFSILSIYYVKN